MGAREMMKCLFFAAAVLTTMAFAAPVRDAPGVILASFDGAKSTSFKWQALNDPVMGGQSFSSVKVEQGMMIFNGTCNIVPKLKAPGFAKASTSSGWFHHNKFNDASAFINGSLQLKVRSSTPEYAGFKVEIGAKGVPARRFGGGSFKSDFKVEGTDWQVVNVPFDSFSYDWSDFTGECDTKDPTGQQHVCCSAVHPEVCPKAHYLSEITSLAVWAEGAAGKFHIEVQWIGAGTPTPAAPVCKSSEYCCPDAKACLTPTKAEGDCKKGEVCCPVTKMCVAPGADCKPSFL